MSAPTYRSLLVRGLLAGLIAGLLAGIFAYTAGEPLVDAAVAIEEQTAATHHDDELVSRTGQKGGLILATTLYGVAMGGLLATAYTLLRRRLRTREDFRAATGLAAAALTGIVLIPWLKYPPNPPAVGDPSTIDQRTISYLLMVLLGLVATWSAVLGFRAPRPGAPEWLRSAAATAALLIVVTIGYLILPPVNEVPATFPATMLWNFRIASLGTQVVLWAALGLTFGALITRLGAREPVEATSTA